MSSTENVTQHCMLAGAFAEAKAFKIANKPESVGALERGNCEDGAGAFGDADAVPVAATAPRVCIVLAGGGKGIEIGGELHTWDSLQSGGHIGPGDRVVLHYLGSYFLKVAASVGAAAC